MDNHNADLETAVDLLAVDPELQQMVDETVLEAAQETEGGEVTSVSEPASEAEQADLALAGAKQLSFGILKVVAMAAQWATKTPITFSDGEKQDFAEKVAPAFAKYSGSSLNWMEQYREEFDAVNAIGTIGTSVYVQIAMHQAEMQRIAQEQAENGGEHGNQPE
ncbi:hypothetical protein AAOGI_06850 [Agarivorans albus]